jgi:hypothetical protein
MAAALGSLTTGDAMTGTATGLGTFSRVDRTGGQLSAAERRSLLRPLAQALAVNAAGRLLMLVKLNSGRRAQVVPAQLLPPSSALTAPPRCRRTAG